MRNQRLCLCLNITTALCAWSMVTYAQDGPPAAEKKPRVLEEVMVTAERREASLQQTDISLSVFNAQALEETGVSNFSDIDVYTPNLTVQPLIGGRAGFAASIRGVRSGESLISFDPKVALYLDGVLIAKNAGSALDVIDLERMEILRGPQGTLYGRNTVGGAINIITKKPSDEFGGNISTTIGNYSQQDLKGVLNVPLIGPQGVMENTNTSQRLNMKVALASLNRDGFWENDYEDAKQTELDDRDRLIGHLQLQWDPSDIVSILYSYDTTKIRENATAVFATSLAPAAPASVVTALAPHLVDDDDNPDSISVDGDMIRELDTEGHSITADFHIGEVTLTSITAYREMDNTGAGDADGSPTLIIHTEDIAEHEQITQEFRLVGSLLDSRLDYVAGAFYMNEKGYQENYNIIYAFGVTGAIAEFENDIWAVYGEGTYHFTDRLEGTLGVRYTEEDREMTRAGVFNTSITPTPKAQRDFNNISPAIGLSYQWMDNVLIYGKVSKGYQSGGFNARIANANAFQRGFDEETLIAYEVGLKSDFWDGRARVNVAAFYSEYDDFQVNVFDPQAVASNIQNAATIEMSGLELEVLVRPIDSLDLGLNYGYLDPDYKDFIEPGTGEDLSNSNFPFAPEHNVNAFVRYVFPDVTPGNLVARLDYIWQDEQTFLVPSPEPNSASSYHLINARLTLEDLKVRGGGTLKIALWGKNLTDESYWNFGVNLYDTAILGFAENTFGPPRTYGVDVTYEF